MSYEGASPWWRAVHSFNRRALNLLLERLGTPRVGHVYSRLAAVFLPESVTLSLAGTSATFRTTNGMEYAHVAGYTNSPDVRVLEALLSNLQPDDVFWDVGANVGIHTCFAAVNLHAGRVVAFEPNPKNARRIHENLDLNDRAGTVYPYALSSVEGRRELAVNTMDVPGAFGQLADTETAGGVEVETKPGDALLATGETPKPSVIKIDVQGAEFEVLRGMERCLGSSRCRLVYCNVYRKHFEATDEGRQLRSYLEGFGFEVARIGTWEDGYFIEAAKPGNT